MAYAHIMSAVLDKRFYPAYALWLAAVLVPLLSIIVSLDAGARSKAVLSQHHILSPSLAPSASPTRQTDYVAVANDQILARGYGRLGSIAGSISQPISFAFLLLGIRLAARTAGRHLPWTAWLMAATLIASAASNIAGVFLADRISDHIDSTQAMVYLGTASQADLNPLHDALQIARDTSNQIRTVFLYGMVACLAVLVVQILAQYWHSRWQPSQDRTALMN